MQTIRVSLLSIAVLVLAAACGGDAVCGTTTCGNGQACVMPMSTGAMRCATLCGANAPAGSTGCTASQQCVSATLVPPAPPGVDHNASMVEVCQ